MNYELRELYQETILDHNRHPRNRKKLEEATAHAHGHNPLCGDNVTIYIQTENGLVKEISFEGNGCAISTASASLMTEAVQGKTVEEAEKIFKEFQEMVTATEDVTEHPELGDLEVLAGVREYPVRIKCATLPWHTLQAALNGGDSATTE